MHCAVVHIRSLLACQLPCRVSGQGAHLIDAGEVIPSHRHHIAIADRIPGASSTVATFPSRSLAPLSPMRACSSSLKAAERSGCGAPDPPGPAGRRLRGARLIDVSFSWPSASSGAYAWTIPSGEPRCCDVRQLVDQQPLPLDPVSGAYAPSQVDIGAASKDVRAAESSACCRYGC